MRAAFEDWTPDRSMRAFLELVAGADSAWTAATGSAKPGSVVTVFPSIHQIEPLERGGVVARQGFDYQDHVAVAFLLEMLSNELLLAVWCEAEDDITLIRQAGTGEEIEYVQVKRTELNQLWTAAKLCERSAGSGGRSIIEKSMEHDRCSEPSWFRIVSAWHIDRTLRVLQLPVNHAHRQLGHTDIEAAVADIRSRAAALTYRSPRGNGVEFWVRRVVWDVRESVRAVENSNLLALEGFVHNAGAYLAPDQRRNVYERLLRLAQLAAGEDWLADPDKKKLRRTDFMAFVRTEIERAQHPASAAGGRLLRRRMESAGLSAELILTAADLRRRYRHEVLNARYLSVSERDLIEAEVAASMHALFSALDCRALSDSGPEFHDRCIRQLRFLRDELPTSRTPPMWALLGAMYDLVQRGQHSFVPNPPPVLTRKPKETPAGPERPTFEADQ